MEFVLPLIILLALAVIYAAWKASDWIGAKAEEARQRARKSRLENDKLELEVLALKSVQN